MIPGEKEQSDACLQTIRWWKFFCDIDVLIEQIKSIQFKLIPRKKNNLTDFLTKAGLQRSSFLKAWW
ncbi:hypothetical protein GQ457_05G002290 [Hibiscus cannabinus]